MTPPHCQPLIPPGEQASRQVYLVTFKAVRWIQLCHLVLLASLNLLVLCLPDVYSSTENNLIMKGWWETNGKFEGGSEWQHPLKIHWNWSTCKVIKLDPGVVLYFGLGTGVQLEIKHWPINNPHQILTFSWKPQSCLTLGLQCTFTFIKACIYILCYCCCCCFFFHTFWFFLEI